MFQGIVIKIFTNSVYSWNRELSVLWLLIGAALGFLWFNAPPAKVFMGDTGSLALGGSLGNCNNET